MAKAFTLKQPHAHMVATGMIDAFGMNTNNKYRGELYIHAGSKFDEDMRWFWSSVDWVNDGYDDDLMSILMGPKEEQLPKTGIIGKVLIYDIVPYRLDLPVSQLTKDYLGAIMPKYVAMCKNPVTFLREDVEHIGGARGFWKYDVASE